MPRPARALLTTAALLCAAGTAFPQEDAAGVQQRFVDGRAAVMPEFEDPDGWVRHDLWVETASDSDGDGERDRVHVAVTRQGQTASAGLKVPAILSMSPYHGRALRLEPENFWDTRHPLGEPPEGRTWMPNGVAKIDRPILSERGLRTWVRRGYAVVHSSAPGTGLSQGCPTVGGQNEYDAPKAVVAWLCGRADGFTEPDGGEPVAADWCTGKVGMTGGSYNGTLALAAATTGVEGLEVVVPVAPNTSYYHYYRSHGLVRSPGGFVGEDADVLGDAVLAAAGDRADFCDCLQKRRFSAANLARDTGDWNDFWAASDLLPRLDGVRCPVLMAHAFNDWNVMPEHSVRVYERLKELGVPAALYMHQGGHDGWSPPDLTNLWFTAHLFGVDNGWDDGGRAWVVREGDPRNEPTRYPDYPHPDAAPVELALTPGAPGAGGLTAAPAAGNPVAGAAAGGETFTDDPATRGRDLAGADRSDHRLLYKTGPLAAPLHLSGTPEVDLSLASDRPAANLSVWLVSLPWGPGPGVPVTDDLVTRGWADPQNHATLPDGPPVGGEPLTPGETYRVRFALQPDDQVLPAGAELGLVVFASDPDFTVAPAPGTEVTVFPGASRLRLPVVGGEPALRAALSGTAPPASGDDGE